MNKIFVNRSRNFQRVYRPQYYGLLVILLVSFWLMLYILNPNTFSKADQKEVFDEKENGSNTELNVVPGTYYKYSVSRTKYSTNSSLIQQALRIKMIRRKINEFNKLQTILNEDIFGPLQNDSLVIVVQVHNRLMYLRHTINSLAQTKGIENALLVFSHDYYDEEINSLIQSIDFCKVMQIFYPYSIQTHPNRFPGESKNDCPKNINIKEAVKIKCDDALHPDHYGHYRDAKGAQIKHHWWWKVNRVFDGLNVTKNYTGLMVFLEEDHYVAQDFIYMIHLMHHVRQSSCPNCKIFSLGSHSETFDFVLNSAKAERIEWSNGMENMGLTFNRSVWEELKSCADTFCTFDDYNWDWTLLAVSNKCLPEEITAMVLQAPRVFHIGECGFHYKNACNSTEMLNKVQKLLKSSTDYLYPKDLDVTDSWITSHHLKYANPNGGWGDTRDHNLCLEVIQWS